MMRVLFDTDVVLDVFANRQPFAVEASVLWLANERGRIEAYVSPITRNLDDYANAPLQVFSPAEALKRLLAT
jgi:hypothetical protein